MNKQSNNFEVLELAKEAFKHLPEPDNGWYFKYDNSEDRKIIAASSLGKWYMYTKNVLTYGQVANSLMTYFQLRDGYSPDHIKASDAKLKDYIIVCWGERNHNEIEYASDYRLRKLLQQHHHQNLEPGQHDYFAEFNL